MRRSINSSQLAYRDRRIVTLLLLWLGIAFLTGIGTPPITADMPSRRTLRFAERVAHQYAIEEVYWRHRIWPKDNPGAKPGLDALISREQTERRVTDYLRKSQAATDERGSPITATELPVEMDPWAPSHTRRPDVLRELFTALGNDPFVIPPSRNLSSRLCQRQLDSYNDCERTRCAPGPHCSVDRQRNDYLGRVQLFVRQFEHRREIQSCYRQLDRHQHHQRAQCPMAS